MSVSDVCRRLSADTVHCSKAAALEKHVRASLKSWSAQTGYVGMLILGGMDEDDNMTNFV